MDLSTLLLARTATAADIRPVMDLLRSNRRIAQRSDKRIGTRIDSVEDDLSLLALTLMALVGSLVEKGVLSENDLHAHLQRLDGLDGVEDGKLDPDALRGVLGLPRKPDPEPQAPVPAPKSGRRRSR